MMLERIQRSIESPIVKVILFVIIIFFVFAGYFTASLFSSNADQVAEVEGQVITQRDVDQAVASRRQSTPNFDTLYPTESSLLALQAQIKQQLINEKVLTSAIVKSGLVANEELVDEQIRKQPAFHDENGVYSSEKARTALAQAGLGTNTYRNQIAEQIVRNQFIQGVQSSAFPLSYEVETLYRLQEQTRKGRVLRVAKDKFIADIAIDDAAVTDYYTANQQRFEQPEKVNFEYVRLSVANLTADALATITDAQINASYEENKDTYSESGTIQVAHILIENSVTDAEQKSNDLLVKIKAGGDFAQLAKDNSSDLFSAENGGLLDAADIDDNEWLPEFQAAALTLTEKGQVSEVVKSEYGYHIIKLVEKVDGVVKPLVEVSEQIKQKLAADVANTQFYEKQAALTDALFSAEEMNTFAQGAALEVKESGLFERSLGQDFLANPALIEKAFSTELINSKEISDEIKLADNDLIYIKVKQHQPAGTKALELVKAQITEILTQQQAQEKTKTYAEQIKAAIDEAKDVSSLLTTKELVWVENDAFARTTPNADRELVLALFNQLVPQEEGKNTVNVESLQSGDYAVIELQAVTYPELSTLDEAKRKQLELQLNYTSSNTEINSLLEELKSKTSIK